MPGIKTKFRRRTVKGIEQCLNVQDEGHIMVEQQERAGSHLLGLLNPAMVIAGNLIAISLAMENSAWAPFVASIGAIWMLGLGPLIETLLGDRPPRVGASESGGPFHALLFLHALCHFGGVLSLLWLANSIGFQHLRC